MLWTHPSSQPRHPILRHKAMQQNCTRQWHTTKLNSSCLCCLHWPLLHHHRHIHFPFILFGLLRKDLDIFIHSRADEVPQCPAAVFLVVQHPWLKTANTSQVSGPLNATQCPMRLSEMVHSTQSGSRACLRCPYDVRCSKRILHRLRGGRDSSESLTAQSSSTVSVSALKHNLRTIAVQDSKKHANVSTQRRWPRC